MHCILHKAGVSPKVTRCACYTSGSVMYCQFFLPKPIREVRITKQSFYEKQAHFNFDHSLILMETLKWENLAS